MNLACAGPRTTFVDVNDKGPARQWADGWSPITRARCRRCGIAMGRGIQKALTTSGQQVLERYRALAEVVESTRPRARGRARNYDGASTIRRSAGPAHLP